MIRFVTTDEHSDLPDLSDLEIADTPAKRERGLKGRKPKPMLFPGAREKRRTFTMKGVPEPLDFVFLDAEGVVVEVQPNVPPETPQVQSQNRFRDLLELPAGGAKRLKPGDRLPL